MNTKMAVAFCIYFQDSLSQYDQNPSTKFRGMVGYVMEWGDTEGRGL